MNGPAFLVCLVSPSQSPCVSGAITTPWHPIPTQSPNCNSNQEARGKGREHECTASFRESERGPFQLPLTAPHIKRLGLASKTGSATLPNTDSLVLSCAKLVMLKLAPLFLCLASCVLLLLSAAESHSGNDEEEAHYDTEYEDYDNETEEEYEEDYDEDYEYDPFGCEAKDKCKGTNRSKESLLNPSDMSGVEHWRTACFCDEDCWRYSDCCLDAPIKEDSGGQKTDWRCDLLPGYGEYIYVIGYCPPNWKNRHEAALCERRIFDKGYNFLLDIPVFSNSTKRSYSNVFCARCNGETDLSSVQLDLLCPFHLPNCSYHLHRGNYVPGQLIWNVNDTTTNVTLTLKVDYFADWENLKRLYKPRRCWPIIDTCPLGRPDDLYSNFCHKNTSFVRTFFPLGSVKFKNIDCALCNDINPTEIECVADPHPDYTSTPILPHLPNQPAVGLFYSWYMDFHDSTVEGPGWQFRCLEGDLLHPIYKVCVPFTCGQHFIRVREQCVRLRTNDTSLNPTGCKMLVIDKDDVTWVKPNGIYIDKTKMTYRKGEFEELDKFSFLVCERSKTLSSDSVKPKEPSCASKLTTTLAYTIFAITIILYDTVATKV